MNACERLWDREFARAVDRISIETFGRSSLDLMERAGLAVARQMQGLVADKVVLVFAGPGNNGGDALVVARLLGADFVQVFLVDHEPSSKISEGTRHQLERMKESGIRCELFSAEKLKPYEGRAVVVLDGIVGIGFSGVLRAGAVERCLRLVAKLQNKIVVAIDCPSGVDVDALAGEGPILVADRTITFGGFKPAQIASPARKWFGKITVEDINFGKDAVKKAKEVLPEKICISRVNEILALDPWKGLGSDINKYDRGHVLIIGGSAGKVGAPVLAATAALRMGCGWVTVSLPEGERLLATYQAQIPPDLTFENLFDGEILNSDRLECFLKDRKVKSVVLGPGCVNQPITKAVAGILATFSLQGGFVVIDAGATGGVLDILAHHKLDYEKVLLTPHPGEWMRLTNPFLSQLSHVSQFSEILARCQKACVTLCHKGATPIVFSQAGVAITDCGDATLAKAGTGDVLAGVCAAHGARGVAAEFAFLRSQAVVAEAAKLAAIDFGSHGIMASDLVSYLNKATSKFNLP